MLTPRFCSDSLRMTIAASVSRFSKSSKKSRLLWLGIEFGMDGEPVVDSCGPRWTSSSAIVKVTRVSTTSSAQAVVEKQMSEQTGRATRTAKRTVPPQILDADDRAPSSTTKQY